MNPLLKLDHLSHRFWSRLLSLLCGLTGRNNFFFARWFGGIGGSGMTLLTVILTVYDLQETSLFAIWDLLNVLLFVYLTRLVFRLAKRLEAAFESGEINLNIMLKDVIKLVYVRIFGTIFVIIGFLGGSWFQSLFAALLLGSFYFLTDFRPKSKSKVRKLAEAAGRKLGDIHLPSPVPNPTPT